jgi:hypothetical protein
VTRSVAGIDEHEPLPDARVRIILTDDTRLIISQLSKMNIKTQHQTDEMLYDTISRDPGEIKEVINEISGDLPDDVERTARRLLRLSVWLNARNNDTCSLPIYGSYRSLRSSQNQLVLVEEGSERMCDRVLPFVVSFHKPSQSNHDQTVKSRLNRELRKWTLRAVSSFIAGKFKESGRQIVATEFQTVESLRDAERIVKDEPLDVTSETPDTKETVEQLSFDDF